MEYSETLAEIIGIILGDGSLRYDKENHKYNLTIYLNGVDDHEYFQYVKKILDQFFQTDIYEYWYKDSESAQGNEKGVSLTIYDKEILYSLIKKGLIPGNKIENNISVPNWIKSDNSYSLRCLRGLTDTDGYIGVVKTNNPQFSKIAITYTSKLTTLVNDFKDMSEKNNIQCSNIHGPYSTFDNRTNKNYTLYSVSIHSKEQVNKYLQLVKPKKWEYRRNLIGKILYLYNNIQEYRIIKQQIKRRYGNLNFFKKEQENCLNSLINVSAKDIENSLSKAFSYHKMHYSNEFAEELKENLIRLGSLREVEKIYNQEESHNFKIYRKSITRYLQKLFTQDSRYKELYDGIKGFNKWKDYNFNILIRERYSNRSIYRYPFFIKAELCKEIYHVMEDINNINEIYKKLESIIENQDLNGEIIDKQNFYVLKFERLAYLLKDPNTNSIVHSELKSLIYVIKEFKNILKEGKKLKLEDLSSLLRNKYNTNWKHENLKALLIHLNLYDNLIQEDLNFDQNVSPIETEEHSIDKAQHVKEISEGTNTYEKNKTKNIHTSNFQSTPYPYNNHRNGFDEIDFTEMYGWLSPQVREQMAEKAESLQQEIREDITPKEEIPEKYVDKIQNRSSIEELELRNEKQQLIDAKDQHIEQTIVDLDNIELKTENNTLDDIDMELDEDSDIEDDIAEIEDQEQSANDESEKEISSDKEIEAEQEISEEYISEEPEHAEQEQELSESELEGEEDFSSDSNWDDEDTYPPLSELNDDREDSGPSGPIPDWVFDAIEEVINELFPESTEAEGTAQEQTDDPSGTDNSDKLEEDSKPSELNEDPEKAPNDEKSNALEEEKNQSNDTPDKPAEKIQEEDIAETKSDSDNSDDQLNEKENKDDKSDDIEEKEDLSPDSNNDVSGIKPDDDIYDPINVPINELDPAISTLQSSNLGDYSNNFDNITYNNFKDDFDFDEDISLPSIFELVEEIPIKKDDIDDGIDDEIDDYSFDDDKIL